MRFFSPLIVLSVALVQLQASTPAHGRLLLYTEDNCQGEAVHLPCTKSFGGEHKCEGGAFKSFHVPHLSGDETDPKSKLPRLSAMFVWPNSNTCCLPDANSNQCEGHEPQTYIVNPLQLTSFQTPGCHSIQEAFNVDEGSQIAMECFSNYS